MTKNLLFSSAINGRSQINGMPGFSLVVRGGSRTHQAEAWRSICGTLPNGSHAYRPGDIENFTALAAVMG